jgi:hypothetical protein
MASLADEVPDIFAWLGDAAYTDVLFDGAVADESYVQQIFDDSYYDADYTTLRSNGHT